MERITEERVSLKNAAKSPLTCLRATLTGFSVQCPEDDDFAIKHISLPASEI
jgi:hypothetical protein